MQQHVRTLGWLFIVYHAFFDLVALVVLVIMGGAGALAGDRQGFFISGAVGLAIAAVLMIISVPGIIAGIGLLKYQQWARILALIVAVLHLFSFPFGTALGIYAFWVLLNTQAAALFEKRPQQ
jgi:hypothetical protein